MDKSEKRRVLILGAGLSGLAAGYELIKAGHKVTIIEKENAVGGLARTIEKNGFHFDTGPHRWYTKNDMVNTWMLKLLGDEVMKVPRLTRIYFDQHFFEYPIKIKNTLQGIGILRTSQAIVDYFFVKIKRYFKQKEAITLEDGYIQKFGNTLYQLFFKRYSEKLWGTSCKNISADWIGQRTRGFNITTIIKEVLFKSHKVVSFVDQFSYPKRGIGRIAEKLAEDIIKNGGKILTNTVVKELIHNDHKIISIIVKNKSEEKTLKAEEYINSTPISDLISALNPKSPKEVMQINKLLRYRDEVQVALFVKKTKIIPDTWIYVHSFDIPYVRLMEMDNWSKNLSPKGTTTLVFEVACTKGDQIWTKTDKEIVKLVTDSFINEFHFLTNRDIIDAYVHRVEKEYPIYHLGYKKNVNFLKNFLSKFTNLQIIGRNGTFRYNNMDHSIEMGLYAAWNVIENERKFDIESVNIEREYLEEKKINSKDLELPEDSNVEINRH